jgi:hypothetical protein
LGPVRVEERLGETFADPDLLFGQVDKLGLVGVAPKAHEHFQLRELSETGVAQMAFKMFCDFLVMAAYAARFGVVFVALGQRRERFLCDLRGALVGRRRVAKAGGVLAQVTVACGHGAGSEKARNQNGTKHV